MSIYIKAIPLILLGVTLNAFAQIAMKKAVGAAGMEWSFWPLVKLFTHPWMFVCMGCYAVSVVLWAGAIKWVPASYAFPFMALGFVFVALMSKMILGETIPVMRWVSISIIVLGVCLQAFTDESRNKTSEALKPSMGINEFDNSDNHKDSNSM
ncbi:MAG: EamA family transporter [Holophagales bacterium]|jgi:drug/metabolite transporter (DMT)-like permease|nr:EamA family transporter [Holophagales bacterium]